MPLIKNAASALHVVDEPTTTNLIAPGLPLLFPEVDDTPVPRRMPQIEGVRRGLPTVEAPAGWRFDAFVGRLCEVSGDRTSAALTLVFRLVHECQLRGEPAAWITLRDSVFFPPDVAASGVDLAALAVVRVADAQQAAQVADHLLRSGAFGVVAIDFGTNAAQAGRSPVARAYARAQRTRLPHHALTRLSGLASKHDTALLCITNKDPQQPSIDSLVSLRAQASRTARAGQRYRCEAHVIKDKRRGPGWTHREMCDGPDGLC